MTTLMVTGGTMTPVVTEGTMISVILDKPGVEWTGEFSETVCEKMNWGWETETFPSSFSRRVSFVFYCFDVPCNGTFLWYLFIFVKMMIKICIHSESSKFSGRVLIFYILINSKFVKTTNSGWVETKYLVCRTKN